MPQSLSRILVHLVFSTKNRTPWLTDAVRGELHPYLSVLLNDNDCRSLQVGGVDDHVHLLFGLSRTCTIAEIVETLKVASSKWMKTKGDYLTDFHWQHGYGAFSIGQSQTTRVVRYIQNQPEHHRRISFQDEFRGLLERYQIAFDERYVWD